MNPTRLLDKHSRPYSRRTFLKVIAATGDKHNALLFLTVRASFGPGAPAVTLPMARLYLVDDSGKITSEKVIFYAAEG